MPDTNLPPVTISSLPQANEARVDDQIEVTQGGASRSIKVSQLVTALAPLIPPGPTGPAGPTGPVAPGLRLNAQVYGVLPSASASANASALLTFFNACNGTSGYIPAGTINTNAVAVTSTLGLDIVCDATLVNAAGTGQTANLLQFTGTTVGAFRWKGGVLNCNSGPRSAMVVVGYAEIDVEINEGYGLVAVDGKSSGGTSILDLENCPVVRARVHYAHNTDGTAAPVLGSVPRVVSVAAGTTYLTRIDANIQIDTAINIHSYVVVGNLRGGTANVHTGYCRNAFDNGCIYNVGDAAEVNSFDMVCESTDEPYVNSGSGVLNLYGFVGRDIFNSIGVQNCAAVNVYGADITMRAGVTPFKTRIPNTAAVAFRIYDSVIRATPQLRMVDFSSNGTLEEYVDEGNTWIYHHNSANWTLGVPGGFSAIWSMTPPVAGRCRIEANSRWILVDDTANVPNATMFAINLPTVTELSYWNGPQINRTGNATVTLRLANARQQLFSFQNKYSVSNIASETEANNGDLTSAPPREGFGNAVPTSGYWTAGSVVKRRPATQWGIAGHYCLTAGTPGTWQDFGIAPVLLRGTAVVDLPSIAAGATGAAFTVPVTGAFTSDVVVGVNIGIANTGIDLRGWVSSSNTVTVWPTNLSAAPVDLGSATVTVLVMKAS